MVIETCSLCPHDGEAISIADIGALGVFFVPRRQRVSERNDLGSLLTPPFDEAAKSAFLENLSDPWKLAGFMDFFVRTLLARDHHSVFWGDRMMTLDKSMGFLDDPAFARAWDT